MTLTLFLSLLVILAVAVSLITEAVKIALNKKETKYSSNLVVLIVSIVVGAVGTALLYVFLEIAFTPTNILCILLMPVALWVGSMLGYDKVIQMLEQLKTLKLN